MACTPALPWASSRVAHPFPQPRSSTRSPGRSFIDSITWRATSTCSFSSSESRPSSAQRSNVSAAFWWLALWWLIAAILPSLARGDKPEHGSSLLVALLFPRAFVQPLPELLLTERGLAGSRVEVVEHGLQALARGDRGLVLRVGGDERLGKGRVPHVEQ